MAEPVTAGRGRHGPWLQNAWLRLETRQDGAAVSLVALDGAFRPAEYALAWAEVDREPPLRFERADYDLRPHEDALGAGRRLSLVCAAPRRGVRLRREAVLYDAHPFCLLRVGVTNERSAPLPVRALHVFATDATPRGRLRVAADPASLRVWRNGWQSWAPAMSFGGAQLDTQSAPPTLSPEPPQREPGRFASDDVGVLYDPASGRSLLAGCVTARDLITQVFVDAPARLLDARCLADGLPLPPGDTLWSEWIAVDLTGPPAEQLARYGDALGRMMGARVPGRPPAGWCSWYYFFTAVTEDDVVRNLRFLEQHRRELPVQTVQIDDGYQADIGDWLTTNQKFPRGMAWLASEIKRAGYTPGIWLAPFLFAESSRTFAQHAGWVVRDEAGEPVLAQHNWGRRNFAIDGSDPAARAWLTQLFREVCDGWGYDYVKIDFLFAAAVAGRRHDPHATRLRAYRDALAAVREGVGEGRFILGCGSLMAPSVGFFDGNRIGPDCAPFWRFLTREERQAPEPRPRGVDDNLSVETAVRNTLQRSWMHGRLWANDPDCLLVRTDRTKLSLDETRSLATAIGLSAGLTLSSDDLPALPQDRIDIISMLLPPLPRAAVPRDFMERDMPECFEAAFDRPGSPARLVGLFNFDDRPRDLTYGLPPGRWHAFEVWDERYLGVREDCVSFDAVPPHACRLLALRPELGRPAVVGTTAHIGAGALDISDERWDVGSARLTVDVAPAGKRRRRLYVATARLRPARVLLDGAPLDAHDERDALVCAFDADGDTRVEILFSIP